MVCTTSDLGFLLKTSATCVVYVPLPLGTDAREKILSVLVTVPVDKLVISNIVTAYLIKYSPIYISQSNFLEGLREPTTSRSDGINSGICME